MVKKKLAAACMLSLMLLGNSIPAQAVSPGDLIDSSGIGTVTEVGGVVTIPKVSETNFDTIGKARWSQFNIPDAQTVNFEFTDVGQTIINYIDPTFGINPSLIAGKLNTFGTNGIAGRVFLINPNGVSFVGAQINADLTFSAGDYQFDKGAPSLFVSTLDLATPFNSINDNTTALQFDTFTDGNGFANGIFSEGSEFGVANLEEGGKFCGALKELTFLGNGIAITDTKIDATFNGASYSHSYCDKFNNFLNFITAGEVTVGLSDNNNPRQLTSIIITNPNTVPACTFNQATGVFEDGGVRYFNFDPIDLSLEDNIGSEFQIALCNPDDKEYKVGTVDGFFFLDIEQGVVRIENRSDYFNSTGFISTVKLDTKILATGAYDFNFLNPEPVIFLTSKNPGQTTPTNDPSLIYLCTEAGEDTNLFIQNANPLFPLLTLETQVTGPPVPPQNQVGLLQSGEGINGATLRTKVDTEVLTIDGRERNVINELTDCDPCFGDCGTPPDPAPPPGPTPPTPGDDGGGAAVAIAVPLGVAGAGIGSFLAALPLLASAPQATPITTVMRPYYVMPRTVYDLVPAQQGGTTGAASGTNQGGYYYYPQNTTAPAAGQGYYYQQNTGGAAPVQGQRTYPQQGQTQYQPNQNRR